MKRTRVSISMPQIISHALAYMLAHYVELAIAGSMAVVLIMINPSPAGKTEIPVRLDCPMGVGPFPPVYRMLLS
jgi:hypothetical protein